MSRAAWWVGVIGAWYGKGDAAARAHDCGGAIALDCFMENTAESTAEVDDAEFVAMERFFHLRHKAE